MLRPCDHQVCDILAFTDFAAIKEFQIRTWDNGTELGSTSPNKSVRTVNCLKFSFTGEVFLKLVPLTVKNFFIFSQCVFTMILPPVICVLILVQIFLFLFRCLLSYPPLSLSTFILWTKEKKLFWSPLAGAALHSTLQPDHPSLHLFHLNSFFLFRIVKNISEDTFPVLYMAAIVLLSPFSIPYLIHSISKDISFSAVYEKFRLILQLANIFMLFSLLSCLRRSQFQQWHLIFHW